MTLSVIWLQTLESWNEEMRQNTIQCYLFPCVMPCTQTGQGLNIKRQLNHEAGVKMQQTWIQNKTSTNIESSITNNHTYWISETRSISMVLSVSEQHRVTTKRSWCFDFWMITEGWGALINTKRRGIFLPLAPLSPWRQEWLPTWNQKPKVNLSYTNQLYSTTSFTSQCCCKHHISSLPLILSTCNYIKSSEAPLLNNTALWIMKQTETSSKSVKPVMQKLYHIFSAVTSDMSCKHSQLKKHLLYMYYNVLNTQYVIFCLKEYLNQNITKEGEGRAEWGVSDQLLRAAIEVAANTPVGACTHTHTPYMLAIALYLTANVQ